MRVYGRSRRQFFDELERTQLRPLPSHDFVLCERKEARVSIDYHVEFAGHYYSVPYGLVGKSVHLRATANTVEIFQRHPEQGYRSCVGLIRLARRYEPSRVEAACARVLVAGARLYQNVKSMLEHGLTRVPLATENEPKTAPRSHEYVRGPDYYN